MVLGTTAGELGPASDVPDPRMHLGEPGSQLGPDVPVQKHAMRAVVPVNRHSLPCDDEIVICQGLPKHLANPSFLVGLQEDKTRSALVHGEVVASIEDPAVGYGKLGAVQPDVDQLLHRGRMDRHLKALQLAAACNPHHLRQVPHPDSIIRGQRHDGKGTRERAQDQVCRRCLSQTAIETCMPTQRLDPS